MDVLRGIINEQLELLRLTLHATTQGTLNYRGEVYVCSLSEDKLRTSQPIAMAAGQTVNTLLKCSDWRGIPVRDLYPLARSCIESFINASFLLAENNAKAQRAVRWIKYRAWKQQNRNVGIGEFAIKISSATVAPVEVSEFTRKGISREWSEYDTPTRLKRVGELAGVKAGSRLLAAYALVYATSSEIIHGSPYGVHYFYQAHLPLSPTVEDFSQATRLQLEDILCAVCHAMAGYLSCSSSVLGLKKMYIAEQELFNRLLSREGVDPQAVEELTKTL
ncbi:DUF5677 domain-containing protein [Pseudomonas syringae pv. theae]|uniref:DUF5677 domain-containing protein n=1 Tax=Pseudomonas syringae group TaxID=136849 RepID=UPI0023D319BC|nr:MULTISPECIES: DUF5677 domain-containing protein [Pseudomonas syringae group]MDU8630764.1 DUF5677 domain-containing protein [Pseudomonas syringae group sp. 243L2]GKS08393.1 DUF5677 domain-containing protein [Pseudomonas syringae pv. theae]